MIYLRRALIVRRNVYGPKLVFDNLKRLNEIPTHWVLLPKYRKTEMVGRKVVYYILQPGRSIESTLIN